MLQTVAGLFILWILGVVSSYTLGGFIHILPVAAVAILLFWMIEGGWTRKARVR